MNTVHQLLVVDDDPEEHYLMQVAFTDIGWEEAALFFYSADAFLQHLIKLAPHKHPALLVLDYHMPDINGGMLLDMLKQNPLLQHLPVVMYSTELTPALNKALLQKGAAQCLVKTQTYAEALKLAALLKERCSIGVATC